MEFLEVCNHLDTTNTQGGTLSQASKAYRFGEEHGAFIAREALKALSYLHSKNWGHRDIKSHNIMLSILGEVKLSKSSTNLIAYLHS